MYLGHLDEFVVPDSEDPQVDHVLDVWRQIFEPVVAKVEGSEAMHHPKVARHPLVTEIVVGQVQNFEDRERTEPSGKTFQFIHSQIQDPKKHQDNNAIIKRSSK